MSTLILEVQFIDAIQSIDKEFNTLTEVLVYLHGHREADFDWLSLHDNNTDMVLEGWSDIHQYIRENTGPALPVHKLDNLNWSYAESQHDLSQCSPACNCIKCNTSKTLCNAPCDAVSETSTNVAPEAPLPRVERFSDLPDGTEFYVAQTYAYGGRKLYQKTMEDGGDHNAVEVGNTNIGVRVTGLQLVIRK